MSNTEMNLEVYFVCSFGTIQRTGQHRTVTFLDYVKNCSVKIFALQGC
jgi:hypothetical protein